MSTSSPLNVPGSQSSQQGPVSQFRSLRPPLSHNSDWLPALIFNAKAISAGAESLPFPYVKGVLGTAVFLLETVEKVQKNRDSMKELCADTVDIITVLRDQISLHGDTTAYKFKAHCEELEGSLQDVVKFINQRYTVPRGFGSRLKEFVSSSSNWEEIRRLQDRIREVQKILTVVSPALSGSEIPQSVNNCPSPTRIFQGRQIILDKVHEYFSQHLRKQDIFVLHGLGGAGKTQIALKFIEDSASQFTDIFLIDASTIGTINTGLQDIATRKGVGNSSQGALQWLESKEAEWLLFFDNADDPKIDLNHYFPHCSHGNILITSRNPGLSVYAGSHCVVAGMEETDAVDLLLRSSAQHITDHNRETATRIVKVLCHLPLAIIQAGAFISKSGDLWGYLELYELNRVQLLSERPTQSHDNYSWTVYTTWQISFDKLSEQAKSLFKLCSFLHYQGISEDIFKNATKYTLEPCSPSQEELAMPLQLLSQFLGPSGVWDPICFLNTTNELQAYSLFNFDSEKRAFSIHPLVHDWANSTFNKEYHHNMIAIAGMSLAGLSEQDMELASLWMLPHIDFLMKGNSTVIPDFRHEYGKVYLFAGRAHKAEELQVMVLEKRQSILSEDHPDTLEAMYWLARIHLHTGKVQQSLALRLTILNKWKELLGESDPKTLEALGNLAAVYCNLGKFKEAEEIQIGLCQQLRNILGDDHPDSLVNMGNLSGTYRRMGKLREAQELGLFVLEKQRNILGEMHPDTLDMMRNLAVTYQRAGRLQEAEVLQTLAFNKEKNVLGASHPETLIKMANLAFAYKKLGKLHEAEHLEVLVLEKQRKVLGDNHPNTLNTMGNLGATYNKLGRLQEAMELEVVVLERRRHILGDNHLSTVCTMSNLGSTFNKLERWQEAEILLVEALSKQTNVLSDTHPLTVDTMQSLAVTYTKLGKLKEAEDLNTVLEKSQA
ncbi:hypothetical protein FB451DRAFT_1533061 [Mycena latifolia]|nr:hypothetical protein FB451DRAFT_1533061 [Mycena latifolia]